MKIGPVFFLIAALAAAGAATAFGALQEQDRGPAEMILEGGTRGEVPFPHRLHQEALEDDCQTCHSLFPQKKGSIEDLKAEGKLEPKLVMNKLCTGCHREYRRKGTDTGPITCSECHRR